VTRFPEVIERVEPWSGARAEPAVAVSILVPVSERPEDLAGIYEEYSRPIREAGQSYEFVFAVGPSGRHLVGGLTELVARGEPVRIIEVAQQTSDVTLLKLAARQCSGALLLTLPAYRRITPESLLGLLSAMDRGVDLAVARRWPRKDSPINRFQSRVFHALINRIAGNNLHDVASGVLVMRRELLDQIPLYGDFHRFLPLLAVNQGFIVEEVPCAQHARDQRPRFYRPGVYVRRLLDVLGLFFLLRFTEKPLRFFGLVGSVLSAIGGLMLVWLLTERIGGEGIADRPVLLLGVLLFVLGAQAIALGLIGEIIVFLHADRRPPYRVKE